MQQSVSETGQAEGASQTKPKQRSSDRREVGLRVDESKLTTSYANGFRVSTTADEVILDTGLNVPLNRPHGDGQPRDGVHLLFQIDHRLVMNYRTAKRMALVLGQLVRQHEQRHGEIQLSGVRPGSTPAEAADQDQVEAADSTAD